MRKFKYDIPLYFFIVLIATGMLCLSFVTSGVLPVESLSTKQKLIQHLKSLRFKNLFWLISLPGVIGLILLKRRSEFISFFIKMFYIILAIMLIPVGAAFWSIFSESSTLPREGILAMSFVTWIGLSAIGAFGMAQKEYIFGGYKKDTAWRHKPSRKQSTNDR